MQTGQILLVDDDPALLQALPHAISLRLSGVEVATADSAQEALELLQKQEYDAIVSDIKMPGIDGLALMAKVYERYPETPVLLITGHGEHSLAIAALRGGAYDYIQKPIDRDDFVVALQRALHTRQLRRQIQEQQRALEQSALSLERLVEQRTGELAVTQAAQESFLRLATQELTVLHTHWQAVTQGFAHHPQRTEKGEEIRWRLEDMGRSIRRMERLAHTLQDPFLLQIEHLVLHRTRCNLVEVCQQVLDEDRAGTGAAVTCEVLDDPLEAEVDRERISQVLTHLLSHAHTSSPHGTPISVTLRRAGEEAILSVRAQGLGSRAEPLPHIPEPLSRVPGLEGDSSAEWGWELSLARTIVERHGGRMEVQSGPGQGRKFSLVLPLRWTDEREGAADGISSR
jgi:signal transduction histidine kinase